MLVSLRRAARSSVVKYSSRNASSTAAVERPAARRTSSSFWKRLGQGTLITAGVAGGAIYYRMQTDEGFRRSAYFYAKAVPAYIHYRTTQVFLEDILKLPEYDHDAYYNALHDKYAHEIFDVILTLKGFYIKIAQIGSTRDDFVPKQYLDRAKKLQNDAPSKPIEDIIAIIEASYGKPFSSVFRSIDPKPLGAASIGQAHKAELLDGTTVVVKTQFPDAEKHFRNDITTIKTFCSVAQPAHMPQLNEIEKQFMTEFDYRREADNLSEVRGNIERSPFRDRFVVPQPYKELCTKDVLVMEYLKGKTVIDGINEHFETIARERHTTVEALRAAQEKEDEERNAQGLELRTGPSEEDLRRYKALLHARSSWTKLKHALYDYSLGWVYPRGAAAATDDVDQPEDHLLNLPEILRLVVEVHGHEILVDGCFNGDPHPGNIMLLDDGRIGLIDYGQVKHLPKEQRLQMARAIIMLAEGTTEEIAQSAFDMGFRSKYMDPAVTEARLRIGFDRDDKSITNGQNIQLFFESLEARDPVVAQGDDFVMASRVSILLRGLSNALRYPMSHAKMWAPIAKQVLERESSV
ncbi:unnamed protein product [Aphanomyces euteiches]